ncbi:MAG TPA: AAA family ATPase [Jiangellaceae bacterium]
MLVRAVWLNGTVGVGKTTVGHILAEHLAHAGEAVAFINTDNLGTSWPRPPEDPFNVRLVTKNLGALANNYIAAGTRTIVVAGVVQKNAQLEQFAKALGTVPRLVRLVASAMEIEHRLQGRHGELDDSGLRWHLARAPELDDILDQSDLSMTVVENDGPPLMTAKAVLAAIEWPLVTLR